jgi:hypothetical protein
MVSEVRPQIHYHFPTAVTFLVFGLGMGWVLAMLRPTRSKRAALLSFPQSPRASQAR